MEAATIGQVTAAFGQIADEELKNMGKLADTAATKVSQLSSAWTDFKIVLGKVVSEGTSPVADGTTELLNIFKSSNLTGIDKFNAFLSFFGAGVTPLATNIDLAKIAYKSLNAELEKSAISNSGAAAATLYFNQAIKSGKTASEASVISLENLNALITDYQKQIQKANDQKNYVFAKRLQENLKLLSTAWTTTNTQLRKDTNANAIKQQSDADALAIENLISKLKDYDRILRVFKVGEAKEAVKLIADVTTGALLNPGRFADQPGIKKVQERLFGPETQGAMTPGMLFGPEVQQNIDSLVQNANRAVYAMEKLRNTNILVNQSFQEAATQGLSNFLNGLGDVAAGTVSFGDNILRAISGFMKQFGNSLISIGIAKLGLDNLFALGPLGGPAAIAAGTALVVAAGAISKNMSAKVRGIGTGWGGGGMGGNTGFNTSFSAMDQNITITGRLVGSGRDLIAVIENTNFDNSIRKGG